MDNIIALVKLISKTKKQQESLIREWAEATNMHRLLSKIFDVPVGCTRNLLLCPQYFSCVLQFENP